MAKAKKTETTETGDAAPKKKTTRAPRKSTKKAAAPAQPAGTPLVDTTLAAQNAARILAAKAKLGLAATPESAEKESGNFKQLKESFNKPAPATLNNTIGGILGGQKSNLANTGFGQIIHNQVQGGPKFNVPRRTNG